MKVLFLDIDGVLNRLGGVEEGRTTTRWQGFVGMEPELVARFTKLVEATGVQVVLSSTWRLDRKWRGTMKANGLKFRFLGRTPHIPGKPRGLEIQHWLDSYSFQNFDGETIEKYCILDDDSDMLPGQKHFHTSFISGLTEEIAEEIINYFKE